VFQSKAKDKGRPIRRFEGTEGVVEVTVLMVKLSTGWRCVVSALPWPLYSLVRDLAPIVQEADWVPLLFWMGVVKRKSLATIGVPTPNHPAESLY
jgi:hypothetical protein